MLLIACPHCGPRAEIEFRYGGEAHMIRPGPDCDDATWAAYLYFRDNARGSHAERWRHAQGCGQFFNAIRDTLTDRISQTYATGAERAAAGGDK